MKREDAMQLASDALTELAESLERGQSDALKRYLVVLSRFHGYSFSNAMLIALQRPEASFVAGFHAWRKLRRQVRKGEKGIAIFAPLVRRRKSEEDEDDDGKPKRYLFGFKVVHVFDVSQTDGEPLPELPGVKGDPEDNLARLERVITGQQIELEYSFLPAGTLGMSSGGKITICPHLSPAETFAVLAHELAHEKLHRAERRHETTKTIRETEAEAVAFVVSSAFGLDSMASSSDYIQLYSGDQDTLMESLDSVQKTAAWLIDAIHDAPTASGVREPHAVVTGGVS